jgi:thioredoxin-related protein
MNYLFQVFLFIPLITTAQYNVNGNGQTGVIGKGIHFTQGLSWQEILQRAKAEKKMIFIDCFTTWCGPCKLMEKTVYPQEKVGAFFNKNFLCVKVQMDKTSKDDDFVRSWYNDALRIEKTYSIDAFPTFLFLSHEGVPIHRASGGFSVDKFLLIAADALNPETQSYTLATKYNPENMDTAEMKKVALSIRRSAPELAGKIALAYFLKLSVREISNNENLHLLRLFSNHPSIQEFATKYIDHLDKIQMSEPNNIDIITAFVRSSKDKGFKFLYANVAKADSVKNIGREYKTWFAKNYIDAIIEQEEVEPFLREANEKQKIPDWKKIKAQIANKFNTEYADRLIIKGKMMWYGGQKKYEEYCKYVVEYMEKFGKVLEFDFGCNQYAWVVFKYSEDKQKLKKALGWSIRSILINPDGMWMDTYANILYKLGRKLEALRWQETAVKLMPEEQPLQDNLNKMKNGEPTWVVIK